MLRFAPKFMAVFLCATALGGCASTVAGIASLTGSGDTMPKIQKPAAPQLDKTAPTDLDSGVRQAQLLRQSGQYDDAIKMLSQLMLVASDDPRVVSEYGKTLAQKGRAQDAVEFLNRAIELSSNDWTLYSALGVSYDQLGNAVAARAAYEHALALRPNQPSVLNNYALSRMLANDPEGAHILIAKAAAAGGATDSKIAANIAMLNKLTPAHEEAVATAAAASPAAAKAPGLPVGVASASGLPGPSLAKTPAITITSNAPPRPAAPVAQNAPRSITPPAPVAQAAAPRPAPAPVVASGVVMQAVPFDPYAGPVTLKKPAPKAVAAKAAPAKTAAAAQEPALPPLSAIKLPPNVKLPADSADAKPAPAKPDAKGKPVKAASNEVPALRLTADARNP